MKTQPKSLISVVLVVLIMGMLTACGENGRVGETIPTAVTSTPGSRGYPEGSEPSASLHYLYTVELIPLNVFEDETIELLIMVDEANPTLEAVVTGNAEGIQTTKIAGRKGDEMCWVTIEHKVNYLVTGFFYPADCSFEINITTTLLESSVVSDECDGTVTISAPSAFYHAAPSGPYRFFESLDPIVEPLDDELSITIELSDVWVPTSTGCEW